MVYGIVAGTYWNTNEDGEEGFDYKFSPLTDKVFSSHEEAKQYATEYAKNNGWDIDFVGDDHIYKTDNKNDVADLTVTECSDIDDLIKQVKFWG